MEVTKSQSAASAFDLKLPERPFVGLRPFETHESLLFFGRREQTIELLKRLHEHHFIAVVGSSGCGKSSLIRAGLIPKLLAGFLVKDREQWRIAKMKPGDAPLRNLAAALSETKEPATLDALTNKLKEDGAAAVLEQLAPALTDSGANFLLLVDQFEELFRFGLDAERPAQREEAADFVALLLRLAEQRQLPVYVVLTMRSDFLGDCDNFHGLPEALNRSQYLVPRLTREQRRQAIEGPVRLFGAEIAPRLLDRLLNDVGDQSDQLPVLQHALMRTWDLWEIEEEERKYNEWVTGKAGTETISLPLDFPEYEAVGTIQRALAEDAEGALKTFGVDENLAEHIFRALTATDANNRKLRRPAHISELSAITGANEEAVRKIIERFRANNRSFLLLSNEADPLVDISHESLIRQWPRMDEWMQSESDSAELFKRLLVAARRRMEFYRGKDLAEARDWREKQQPNPAWAKRYDDAPDALASALGFLKQSEAHEDQILADEQARKDTEAARQKRELRRARTFAAVISIALLVAVVLAWYGYRQQQLAKEREFHSRVLLAGTNTYFAAKAFEEKNPVRGYELLDASLPAANQPAPSPAEEVRGFAWYHLWHTNHQEVLTLKGHKSSVLSVAYAPDGKTLASASGKVTLADIFEPSPTPSVVKLWDLRSGQEVLTLKGHTDSVLSVAYAPDGKTLASASEDGTVKVWDLRSGQEVLTLKGHTDSVRSVAYAPDGKTLASASGDIFGNKPGEVKVWDLRSGQEVLTLKGHTDSVLSVAYAPDGKTLASASADGTVKVWDLRSGQELATLKGHAARVLSVAYAPDGKTLASASGDQTVKVWDLRSGQEVLTLKGHTGWVWSVAYAPDGKTLASASGDQTVKVWDLRSGQEVLTLKGHADSVLSVAYAPDGRTLASASGTVTLGDAFEPSPSTRVVKVWDARSGQEVLTLKGHAKSVLSVAYAPDGKTLASAGGDGWAGDTVANPDYSIRLWHAATDEEVARQRNR